LLYRFVAMRRRISTGMRKGSRAVMAGIGRLSLGPTHGRFDVVCAIKGFVSWHGRGAKSPFRQDETRKHRDARERGYEDGPSGRFFQMPKHGN
jgi:hypothetical protein